MQHRPIIILIALIHVFSLFACSDDDEGGTAPADPTGETSGHQPPDDVQNGLTGSLTQGRNLHTATLLADNRVMVIGGFDGVNRLASCEIYDPATGEWSLAASLAEPRCFHTATLLLDGRILVAGGAGSDSKSLVWTELYDPDTDSWSPINYDRDLDLDPTWLEHGRKHHAATRLADGRVLLTGGFNSYYVSDITGLPGLYLRSYEIFDPTTNDCILPGFDRLLNKRYCHTSTLLNNGRVLLVGGYNRTDTYHEYCELYCPQPDTCLAATPIPVGRMQHTAHKLRDGRVLVIAGKNAMNGFTRDCKIYDPDSGTWTATGSMRQPRSGMTTAILDQERILASGNLYSMSTEIFDVINGTWDFGPDMVGYRQYHTMTSIADGVVLIVGGIDNDPDTGGYLASCELFVAPVSD